MLNLNIINGKVIEVNLMTDADIISLIGSVGFPIVMCLLMFYFCNSSVKKLTDTVDKLNDRLDHLIDNTKK